MTKTRIWTIMVAFPSTIFNENMRVEEVRLTDGHGVTILAEILSVNEAIKLKVKRKKKDLRKI